MSDNNKKQIERQSKFETLFGIEVERAYSPDNTHVDYLNDLDFPGEYPFARGIQPMM